MSSEVLGFNIWTKNMPQEYLNLYAEEAHKRQLPVHAIVDDILPSVVYNRSNQQTLEYNHAYRSSMTALGFKKIDFVSEIFPDRTQDFSNLYSMSKRIGLSAFIALLPEKKVGMPDDLTLSETIDACWQLHILETGMSYSGITRYLTGKRSTALFCYAKKIIKGFEFDVI